jgi:hypothetical protein
MSHQSPPDQTAAPPDRYRLGARERRILLEAPSRVLEALEERDERIALAKRHRRMMTLPGGGLGLTSSPPTWDAEDPRVQAYYAERMDPAPDTSTADGHMLALDAPTKLERVAILRAATRLHELGLIERWSWKAARPRTAPPDRTEAEKKARPDVAHLQWWLDYDKRPRRLIHVCRTAAGDEVVRIRGDELRALDEAWVARRALDVSAVVPRIPADTTSPVWWPAGWTRAKDEELTRQIEAKHVREAEHDGRMRKLYGGAIRLPPAPEHCLPQPAHLLLGP